MTTPKVKRNVYCTEPEDRVIAWSCPCCKKCWLFVASREDRKNGKCVFGGPYGGYIDESVSD
jgi:hypothetical protein